MIDPQEYGTETLPVPDEDRLVEEPEIPDPEAVSDEPVEPAVDADDREVSDPEDATPGASSG
ncbi:hypothetical protein E8D34_00475 [Nocardioides sp. GY 10113]|uniref:hypothetical protein n=1 Tax=Nocardioides sp. GY 10113 TaxID=2569761 RepID=UPI0010A8DCD1|nr:hypothetical protein [Nocardioides sp. GY 10113]TIC89032.1 hypothetical protein E8D34_00475 [Nocardioides sp. GY 10113]